jgi:hypothetical protein
VSPIRRAEDDDLADAGERGEHRRRVARPVVLRGPDARARAAIVGDHRSPVAAARVHHHRVVDDERRSGHAPLHVGRLVVVEDVHAPDRPAGRVAQRAQLARRAEDVDDGVGPRRRGARAVAAHEFLEQRVPRRRPELAAGADVVGRGHLAWTALLDRERAAARHRQGGVAAADRLLPERRQAVDRPVRENGAHGHDAVAGRASVRRPVGQRRIGRQDAGATGDGGALRRRTRRGDRCGRRDVSGRRSLRLPVRFDAPRLLVGRRRKAHVEPPGAVEHDPHPEHVVRDGGGDEHDEHDDRNGRDDACEKPQHFSTETIAA